jgi:hypothetical protein
MKKILVFAAITIFAACNSNEPAKTDTVKTEPQKTVPDPMAKEITSPYQIGYSSKFVMDDPKNAESLLTLWKDWDNGDLSVHKDLFADRMEIHFADGSMMNTTRDSMLTAAGGMRSSMTSVESRVDAIMAVKSTDKDEHWALIWGMEKDTNKKGKVDSFYLQETWRFNKAGKADMFYQFKAAATPPKK